MDRRSFFRAAACMAATPFVALTAKTATADEAVETKVVHHFEHQDDHWQRVRVTNEFTFSGRSIAESAEACRKAMRRVEFTA